ncbi:MAG: DUF4339 domain-containing protein [Acidihalobacter sp.]|jgi:hypothetical protein|uniref:DUF4339 domain-containing protein n=1 Tax=Acidihalobacter sp. TaxID=1872108 RepID=UPI00307E6C58
MSEPTDNWYYANEGQRTGPLSFERMKALVAEGGIAPDTSVWPGTGEWRPASETVLGGLFPPPTPTAAVPPPLTSMVSNRYVWASIAVLVVVTAAQLAYILTGGASDTGGVWTLIFIAATLVFLFIDERKVKKAGYPSPASWWMLLFLPTYYWRRAKLLGQRKHHFWIWVGALIFSSALVLGVQSYQQQQGYTIMLEQNACPLVTEIIQKQLNGTATCINVMLGKEMSNGFYKADALLDNGNRLRITVQDTQDGHIEVKVPPQ